jgi:hypothetical protein
MRFLLKVDRQDAGDLIVKMMNRRSGQGSSIFDVQQTDMSYVFADPLS